MQVIKLLPGQRVLDIDSNEILIEEDWHSLVCYYDGEKEEAFNLLYDEYGDDYMDSQLEIGMDVESEHSDDWMMQYTIARDHILEFVDYYECLQEMEEYLSEEEIEDEVLTDDVSESNLLEKAKKMNESSSLQEILEKAFSHWYDNHMREINYRNKTPEAIFQSIKASVKHYFEKNKILESDQEKDIIFEGEKCYVFQTRKAYEVRRNKSTHSVVDSSYPLGEDGKSLALARAKYIEKYGKALTEKELDESPDYYNRPFTSEVRGLTSYRYPDGREWIIIGGRNTQEALSEVKRKVSGVVSINKLQIWDDHVGGYVPV